MNNQVYRIISCLGKEYIVKEAYDLLDHYDKYHLDHSKYYLEKMNIQDARIRGKTVYETSEKIWFKQLRRSKIPKITIGDIDERIKLYLRYPLSIFLNIGDLKNIKIVTAILKQYPLIFYTLINEKKQKLLGVQIIANICIQINKYPLENLNEELVFELWKNVFCHRDYVYQLMVNKDSALSNFCHFGFYSYVYSFYEDADLKIIFPYIKQFAADRNNMKSIIEMAKSEYDLFCISKMLNHLEILDDYLNEHIQAQYRYISNKNSQPNTFNPYVEQDKTTEQGSLEVYVSNITEYAFNKYDSIDSAKHELFRIIPKELLEDKVFLLLMAKKGFSMSKFSKAYQADPDVILEEIKHGDYSSIYNRTPISYKRNFLIKARLYFPKLLFYIDPIILNDRCFMLKYLRYYPSSEYFILGEKLIDDWKFFEKAVQLDNDILSFASKRIRKDEDLMLAAYLINYNCTYYF